MKRKIYYTLSKLIAFYVVSLLATKAYAQVPVANFTGTPVAGCSPLIVSFQDISTGNPTSWNWDFGNGNNSTLRNPTATYFTPGTYNVTLTATNSNGSNTLTRSAYITVYEPPIVNFSANNTSGCFPLRVQFTDLSSPGIGNTNTTWLWDFGNGNTSTQQNPLAVYTTSGFFTVTLKVTNDKGCTKTLTRVNYINVTPGVKAGFTHTLPSVCNAPATISFTNTSTGPGTLNYLWDFGDGNTSTALNPTNTYLASGTYTATLIVSSSAGCVDTFRSAPIIIGGFTTTFTSPATACLNLPASFTNTSVPAPDSTYWTFGDGGFASGLNVSHAYTAVGSYTVWMYNFYPNCQDSVSRTITVSPSPVAAFTAPVTSRCEPPLTVNFQDLSTGGVTAWQWDFGDGNTSTLQNPVHTYTTYGSFAVTLIVTSATGCPDTLVQPNFIRVQRAVISIPELPARGCIPYTLSPVPVINSVDAVTSYEWDFGDGGTSTLANPVYTYVAQGNYTVRLIITTSTGCRDTLIIPNAVRVGTKPVADFSAGPIPVCGRQLVYFTDLSAPADEWLWNFGDGSTSTVQHPTHSYSDTGYFSVRLIAYNFGCPDTLIRTNYTQVLPPIARFDFLANCTNRLQFTFTDQSVAPQSWRWDFGDGSPVVTTQNPVHTFPTLGAYSVKLVVTNGGCADTLVQTVNAINENPDFTVDRTVACKPAVLVFTSTVNNPAHIASYEWDFGNGIITTTFPNLFHTYSTSGNFTVRLVTTDINGCTDTIIKPNYIRMNGPIANFGATNTGGCSGLVTTFNDFSSTDGVNAITNWKFDFGDGVVQNFTAPPFQHTYTAIDTFSVKMIITDAAGCVDSFRLSNIIITTDPRPNFISTDTLSCPGSLVYFTNQSTPASVTHSWDFGDGGTSTATHPNHAYATAGDYTVKLRILDNNGCADSITRTSYIHIESPRADFAMSDSVGSCLPFEVLFNNTSSYYISQNWDFGAGEGNSMLTHPTHYYSTPGTYSVKLLVTSRGSCVDSIYKTITIFDTAGARVDYTPTSGCSPMTMSLTSFAPGPIASYFWDFGDGYTLTTTSSSVTHVYTTFGSFIPKLIMEDPSGCLIPVTGADTLYVTGAKAKFGIDNDLFCDRGTVTFTDSTTFNDPVLTYDWSFGDGGTSTLQHPVYQYNTPGLYTVRLIVQTLQGCRDTLTKPNLISIIQRPLIDIAGDTVVCVNSSITHSGVFLVPDTSAVTWSWNFPNGNSATQQNPNPQYYTIPGTYIVTTIATNSSGCKDTTRQTIYVSPLPAVTMPSQLTVQAGVPITIPAVYSPNTVSWLWSPSTQLSCSNCGNPEASPKFNTLYQVHFTDTNGCSNDGIIELIVICKNANLFIPNTFTPNGDGSNDVFYPRGKGLERVKMLRIFNRWGEVVFEKRDFPVNDAASGWNGTFKGSKPQADVYVYQAEVFCENGEVIRLNGNIALVL